jgi:protein TonB
MIKNKIFAITFIFSLIIHGAVFLFSAINLRAAANESASKINISVMPGARKSKQTKENYKQPEKAPSKTLPQKQSDDIITPALTEEIVYNTGESIAEEETEFEDTFPGSYDGRDAQNDNAARLQYDSLLGAIRQLISSRLVYPKIARQRNIEGTVAISLDVEQNGALSAVRVTGTSGSTILDRAALSLVKNIFPIKTARLVKAEHFTVNICYSLTDSTGGI